MQEAEQSFPQSIAVQETWEHVSYGAVERWHFKMLNDLQRNKAYHDAIIHTVRKNNVSSVLDIGCGTGLLRYPVAVIELMSYRLVLICCFVCVDLLFDCIQNDLQGVDMDR